MAVQTTRGKWKWLYTAVIFINNFTFGLNLTLISGADVDYATLFGISINTLTYQTFPGSGGYLLGSLASFLYRWINRQLALAGFMFLMALNSAISPFCPNIWAYFVATFLGGLGNGGYDSGYAIWLTELWPEKNAAILQASLFVAGIGSVFGPLLVSPFVYGEANVTRSGEVLTNEKRMWNLAIPFGTDGAILAFGASLILLMFLIHRYQGPTTNYLNNNVIDEETKQPTSVISEVPHRTGKIVLMAVCYSFYMPCETLYLSYSDAMWQYLEIKLTAQEAAQLLTILTATYTAGRLLTALISLKLQPDLIMTYHYLLILISFCLLFFGRSNRVIIYTGNALLGFAFSSVYPGFFIFTQKHLQLTEKICSMYSFLGALVSFIMPFVLGNTFREFPMVIFVLEGVFLSVSMVMFGIVRVWIWLTPKKNSIQK